MFMGVVLWVAIHVKLISDLLAYMDNAYSWDFTGNMLFYEPYQKLYPTKQTHLLQLQDELGVPHEEHKQVFGQETCYSMSHTRSYTLPNRLTSYSFGMSWGFPHEELKQVFSSPLTIIGFDVDPNVMTITMSQDHCMELGAAINEFASAGQCQLLHNF